MWGLIVYAILALAGVILVAIDSVKRQEGDTNKDNVFGLLGKVGIGVCLVAGIIFGLWWWPETLPEQEHANWGVLGAPLFAFVLPGFFGNIIGSLIVFCRKKIAQGGLKLPGKIGCVILLALSALYATGVVRGIMSKEISLIVIGGILGLLFFLPGLVLLLKWTKK